jgi:hypothetical protein
MNCYHTTSHAHEKSIPNEYGRQGIVKTRKIQAVKGYSGLCIRVQA